MSGPERHMWPKLWEWQNNQRQRLHYGCNRNLIKLSGSNAEICSPFVVSASRTKWWIPRSCSGSAFHTQVVEIITSFEDDDWDMKVLCSGYSLFYLRMETAPRMHFQMFKFRYFWNLFVCCISCSELHCDTMHSVTMQFIYGYVKTQQRWEIIHDITQGFCFLRSSSLPMLPWCM